jgi:hypothetical protein
MTWMRGERGLLRCIIKSMPPDHMINKAEVKTEVAGPSRGGRVTPLSTLLFRQHRKDKSRRGT